MMQDNVFRFHQKVKDSSGPIEEVCTTDQKFQDHQTTITGSSSKAVYPHLLSHVKDINALGLQRVNHMLYMSRLTFLIRKHLSVFALLLLHVVCPLWQHADITLNKVALDTPQNLLSWSQMCQRDTLQQFVLSEL